MATVTCKICKKKVEKSVAFKVEHISKGGKKSNLYFCNEDEYTSTEKEKEYYKKCQLLIDEIFGEPIIDNTRNKKLSELNKVGYSYETIYSCIYDIKEKIENALVLKSSDFNCKNGMFLKISYCFGIVKKEISNYKIKNKRDLNGSTLSPLEIDKANRKVKQQKRSLMDIIEGE